MDDDPVATLDITLRRLPTGKSMRRLADGYFQKLHDSAGRIRETFFNLRGALRNSSNPDNFAEAWCKKSAILEAMLQKMTEVESMALVATGGTRNAVPVVSNVESVRAANKVGSMSQMEQHPQDSDEEATQA